MEKNKQIRFQFFLINMAKINSKTTVQIEQNGFYYRNNSESGDYETPEKNIDREIQMLKGNIKTLKLSLDDADPDSLYCDEANMKSQMLAIRVGSLYQKKAQSSVKKRDLAHLNSDLGIDDVTLVRELQVAHEVTSSSMRVSAQDGLFEKPGKRRSSQGDLTVTKTCELRNSSRGGSAVFGGLVAQQSPNQLKLEKTQLNELQELDSITSQIMNEGIAPKYLNTKNKESQKTPITLILIENLKSYKPKRLIQPIQQTECKMKNIKEPIYNQEVSHDSHQSALEAHIKNQDPTLNPVILKVNAHIQIKRLDPSIARSSLQPNACQRGLHDEIRPTTGAPNLTSDLTNKQMAKAKLLGERSDKSEILKKFHNLDNTVAVIPLTEFDARKALQKNQRGKTTEKGAHCPNSRSKSNAHNSNKQKRLDTFTSQRIELSAYDTVNNENVEDDPVAGEDELKQENTIESSIGGGREEGVRMKVVYAHAEQLKSHNRKDGQVTETYNQGQYESPSSPTSVTMSHQQAKILTRHRLFSDYDNIKSNVGSIELRISPNNTSHFSQGRAPLFSTSAGQVDNSFHSSNPRKAAKTKKYQAPIYNNKMRNSFFMGTFKKQERICKSRSSGKRNLLRKQEQRISHGTGDRGVMEKDALRAGGKSHLRDSTEVSEYHGKAGFEEDQLNLLTIPDVEVGAGKFASVCYDQIDDQNYLQSSPAPRDEDYTRVKHYKYRRNLRYKDHPLSQSLPYDLSHTVNAQRSFLTPSKLNFLQKMIKTKQEGSNTAHRIKENRKSTTKARETRNREVIGRSTVGYNVCSRQNVGVNQSLEMRVAQSGFDNYGGGVAIKYEQNSISQKPLNDKRFEYNTRISKKQPGDKRVKEIKQFNLNLSKSRKPGAPDSPNADAASKRWAFRQAASTLAISPEEGQKILNISIKNNHHVAKLDSKSRSPNSPLQRENICTATIQHESTDRTLENQQRPSTQLQAQNHVRLITKKQNRRRMESFKIPQSNQYVVIAERSQMSQDNIHDKLSSNFEKQMEQINQSFMADDVVSNQYGNVSFKDQGQSYVNIREKGMNVEKTRKEGENSSKVDKVGLHMSKDLSKKTRQIAFSSFGTPQMPPVAPGENNILEELSFAEHSAVMLFKSSGEPEVQKGKVVQNKKVNNQQNRKISQQDDSISPNNGSKKTMNQDIRDIVTDINQDEQASLAKSTLQSRSPGFHSRLSKLANNYEPVKGKQIHLTNTCAIQSLRMKNKSENLRSSMLTNHLRQRSGLIGTPIAKYSRPQTRQCITRQLPSPSLLSPLGNYQSRTKNQLSSKASTICIGRNNDFQQPSSMLLAHKDAEYKANLDRLDIEDSQQQTQGFKIAKEVGLTMISRNDHGRRSQKSPWSMAAVVRTSKDRCLDQVQRCFSRNKSQDSSDIHSISRLKQQDVCEGTFGNRNQSIQKVKQNEKGTKLDQTGAISSGNTKEQRPLPLEPSTVEFLRQRTLYKMQAQNWKRYDELWVKFKQLDHMTGQPPIPPSCSTLTLHLFLTQSDLELNSIKSSISTIWANQLVFAESFKEAKRRLQICSIRIIDPSVFIKMKNEITSSYDGLLTNKRMRSELSVRPRDREKVQNKEHQTKCPKNLESNNQHNIQKAKSQLGMKEASRTREAENDEIQPQFDHRAAALSTSTVNIASRQDHASGALSHLGAANESNIKFG